MRFHPFARQAQSLTAQHIGLVTHKILRNPSLGLNARVVTCLQAFVCEVFELLIGAYVVHIRYSQLSCKAHVTAA